MHRSRAGEGDGIAHPLGLVRRGAKGLNRKATKTTLKLLPATVVDTHWSIH